MSNTTNSKAHNMIIHNDEHFIFTGTCQAGSGVVAAVTSFLADRDCYICALEQFDDESTNKFFMRAVFRRQEESPSIEAMTEAFIEISEKVLYGLEVSQSGRASKDAATRV